MVCWYNFDRLFVGDAALSSMGLAMGASPAHTSLSASLYA